MAEIPPVISSITPRSQVIRETGVEVGVKDENGNRNE